MNVQPCARCGYTVYPAEKINCIGQNWHKSCFHCEVCKMVLTANNCVSHQKKPYCQTHNPKNNTFTSVYETPVNINAKKQSEAVSEVRGHTRPYRHDSPSALCPLDHRASLQLSAERVTRHTCDAAHAIISM
uniref:LIM and SH3 domain protein 1 n=1 Tax=Paramormyrops kingsleyae TaxID=1676925 RepID=A0A3B3SDZ4_9TELE